jgi:hypothetical protein
MLTIKEKITINRQKIDPNFFKKRIPNSYLIKHLPTIHGWQMKGKSFLIFLFRNYGGFQAGKTGLDFGYTIGECRLFRNNIDNEYIIC